MFFASCTSGINSVLPKIIILEPLNNASDISLDIVLKWKFEPANNQNITYKIFFAEENTSSIRALNVETDKEEYKPEIQLEYGKVYIWQVCAFLNENKICDEETKFTIININPAEMAEVKKGNFIMGNTKDFIEGEYDEKPLREVEINYDFYIGKYEITNGRFLEFLNDSGVNPDGTLNGKELIAINEPDCEIKYENGFFKVKEEGKINYPVIRIFWRAGIEFCNWLSSKESLTQAYNNEGELINYPLNKGYRLPTEAEWEYAARGAENDYNLISDYRYSGGNDIDEVSWNRNNSANENYPISNDGKGTHHIGLKKANEIGIYDMTGNVWEWCYDYQGDYSTLGNLNPVNNAISLNRVMRGGAWNNAKDVPIEGKR